MTPWFDHQLGLCYFLGALLVIALINTLFIKKLGSYPPKIAGPRVSILVPCRNEAANVEPCFNALLAQDYRDVEVIALDDASEDGTRTALTTIAARNPRLKVLTGTPPPTGWQGKAWACERLAAAASGDWLLFTDADTRHAPTTVGRALAAACQLRADLLTALTRQAIGGWGERLTVPLVPWAILAFLPIPLAHALGVAAFSATNGQFLLIKKTAYERAGGHAAIKDQVTEDLALGRRVIRAGLRWRFVDAQAYVTCRMYGGFRAAFDGFTKNLFGAFDYNAPFFLFVGVWLLMVFGEPLMVLAAYALRIPLGGFAPGPAALAVATAAALWSLAAWKCRFPLYTGLLYPGIMAVMGAAGLRSFFLTVAGRTQWKGRVLPRPRIKWFFFF